jgi:hypothetical protein
MLAYALEAGWYVARAMLAHDWMMDLLVDQAQVLQSLCNWIA